jgi:type IV pilus assembly protein PilM
MKIFGFGSESHIGVNIGSSSIKIADVKKSGKQYVLEHFGIAQLDDGVIENSEIINQIAVIDALKNLVSQLKIKGKFVTTSVSGASVVIKKIYIPQTPDKELEDTILWEAEQYIPFDIKEVVLDYQVLKKSGPDNKMEILLVACKQNVVNTLASVIQDSGLQIANIDVDVFAIQNCFEVNYPQDPPCMVVDIGASAMRALVFHQGDQLYSREVGLGGKWLTQEIQKHLNLSYQEAEVLKIEGSLGGQMPQEVADLVSISVENIAQEIKRSLDFFQASQQAVNVAYVLLTGGAASLLGLTKYVEELLGLPTQIFNPFQQIKYNEKYFNESTIQTLSTSATVSIGLALRGLIK